MVELMEQRNYKLYVHIAPNGKRYYGITKLEPKKRWGSGKGYSNQYFSRAIEKYGWQNIEHIILFDSLTEEQAKELEQYFIQWYDTTNPQHGYNISPGGEAGNHSEETRKKISDKNRGRHYSEETRKKISDAHKGKKLSAEHKQKLRDANGGRNNPNYGKHHSEETKKKLSKPVICITTKKLFYGAHEAQRQLGISSSNITNCCKGKLKSSGKYNGQKLVWRYINYKHNKTYRIKNELRELTIV